VKDRQSVWSDKRVRELSRQFIPVADAIDRMQKSDCSNADAQIFQKFARQRTYTKRNRGGAQGHYMVTPSGELLASSSMGDPKVFAQLMEEALEKWDAMPREKRLLPEAPDPDAPQTREKAGDLYPGDGLVLRSISRDLKRARWPDWNLDYAWFRKDEARRFLPSEITAGAEHDVPAELVGRLVRFHLIDNVYGLNYTFFPKEAVKKAELKVIVETIDGSSVSLSLAGETIADTNVPEVIGFAPKLMGKATWDTAKEEFTEFELVAVGVRHGLGNCNLRRDPAPAPMGIVFTLANDTPAERLPPAFVSRYEW
jgi:hypothetical protein